MTEEKRKGFIVKHNFNNDFVELWEELRAKYGEKVFAINGLDDKSLDVTTFPKNFYNKSATVASVSVDANANVASKDISQYTYERFKAMQKLNSIYLMYKWVKKLFSKKDARKMVEKLINGEIFINDLTNVEKPYCFAFDLNNLLADGMSFFGGSNMTINPPKRAESYIAQVIQTTAFISNQIMGAVAYPSFFPILDKFYRQEYGEDYVMKLKEDNKMSQTIKNHFQNLIFSFNFPFRGNQCVDLETEVLTPQGFKKYNELNVGDEIYTWNDGKLNIQKVQKVNVHDFNGDMHSYSSRDLSQFITPNHRVLFQNNNYKSEGIPQWAIKESRELIDKKTPLVIPIAFEDNLTSDYDITDDELKLLTCIITDGHIDIKGLQKDGYVRQPIIQIIKSERRSHNLDIQGLLDSLDIKYSIYERKSCFSGTGNENYGEYAIKIYKFSAESSKKYVELLSGTKTELPEFFMKLSKRQANIVLDTWSKMDGYQLTKTGYYKLQCDNELIQDQLQQLAVLACVGSKKTARWIGKNKKPTLYVMTYARKSKSLVNKEKVHYEGKVWCPTTEDGVVVFRKNGSIFISGNSSFTNLSVLDKGFMEKLFNHYTFADDGTSPNIDSSIELSKAFFEYFVDIQNKEGVFTFPVMTLAVSLDENRNYLDEGFIKWIAKVNAEKSVGNIFQTYPTKFSSCCRLTNDFSKLSENHVQNSFGANGLNIGSHRVCGINLPRLAILEKTNSSQLDETIDIVHKTLYAHRKLIEARIEAGVLPLYTTGWMELTKQFSTVGLIGGYEYVKNKGLDILTDEGSNALLKVMKRIEEKLGEYAKQEQSELCSYNIESIPGESMAVRLCDLDKLLGYCDKKVKLYSNQYVSLMDECSLYDRMRVQAKFDQVTSGGSIMHCTYKDAKPLSPAQYEKVIRLAKDLGNEYFAINYAYCLCEQGHRTVGDHNECPICGSPITDKFQRVVGFITKVSVWSPVRRDYEYEHRTSQDIQSEFPEESCV